jgi:hypothetical protein
VVANYDFAAFILHRISKFWSSPSLVSCSALSVVPARCPTTFLIELGIPAKTVIHILGAHKIRTGHGTFAHIRKNTNGEYKCRTFQLAIARPEERGETLSSSVAAIRLWSGSYTYVSNTTLNSIDAIALQKLYQGHVSCT